MLITTAWQHISVEVTTKGFEKCCTSSAVDGTDYLLWNYSEDNGNVESVGEEDECTDCEDGHTDNDWLRWIESDMLCVFSV
jgi:hypothetical protein